MSLKKSIEARRVGASLVAGFHKADPPLIWRFNLAQNHTFTLMLRKDAAQWVLGLAPTETEFHPIARFTSQEDAEEAFEAIEAVLSRRGRAWLSTILRFLGVSVAVLVVAILVLAGGNLAVNIMHKTTSSIAPGHAPVQDNKQDQPPLKPGIPLPADQYLKPPP